MDYKVASTVKLGISGPKKAVAKLVALTVLPALTQLIVYNVQMGTNLQLLKEFVLPVQMDVSNV